MRSESKVALLEQDASENANEAEVERPNFLDMEENKNILETEEKKNALETEEKKVEEGAGKQQEELKEGGEQETSGKARVHSNRVGVIGADVNLPYEDEQ